MSNIAPPFLENFFNLGEILPKWIKLSCNEVWPICFSFDLETPNRKLQLQQ